MVCLKSLSSCSSLIMFFSCGPLESSFTSFFSTRWCYSPLICNFKGFSSWISPTALCLFLLNSSSTSVFLFINEFVICTSSSFCFELRSANMGCSKNSCQSSLSFGLYCSSEIIRFFMFWDISMLGGNFSLFPEWVFTFHCNSL